MKNKLSKSVIMLTIIVFTLSLAAETLATERDDDLLEKFRKEANTASFTVYPVFMSRGKPLKNVGDVIGLFMEQGGMENVQPTSAVFLRAEKTTFENAVKDFSLYVAKQEMNADYSLYAEVLGQQKTGVDEIRVVIVNGEGELVWKYQSLKGSKDFKKYYPSNPMTCSVMISSILKKEINLKKRSGFIVRDGNMTTYWARNTGIPDKREMEAIKSYSAIARKTYKTSSVTVFPVVVWGPVNDEYVKLTDKSCADNIAGMLDKKVFASATSIDCADKFEFEGNSNQMKVLWTFAKKFSAYLKKNPVKTDYAITAHYLFNRHGKSLGLHIIGCKGTGEIVEVALFNDHHKVFNKAKLDSRKKADKFVVDQILEFLK